jgi:predicted aminopeptidase
VGGDTTFNESFATAVEREGVRRWLQAHGNDASRLAYAEFAQRRAQFLQLLLKYRGLLQQNYASDATDAAKRERKQQLFAELRQEYEQLKGGWGGFAGYDRFFAQDLTNAHLAAVGAYNDLVPAFDALLAQSGGDFPKFYGEVKRIAALPKGERDGALRGVQTARN